MADFPRNQPVTYAGGRDRTPQAVSVAIPSTPTTPRRSWLSTTLGTTGPGAYGPVATGRSGSFDQADHDPGKSAASTSRTASARTCQAAETPEPQ